ncbi:hypothetical protein OEZ79_26915, partial [Leclercia adecarboxylata]
RTARAWRFRAILENCCTHGRRLSVIEQQEPGEVAIDSLGGDGYLCTIELLINIHRIGSRSGSKR